MQPVAPTDRSTPSGPKPTAHAWYTLLILVLIYTTHSIDRNVVNVVLEPLRHDLHLSDTQLGMVGGMAHGITFALSAIPLGLLVDRVNRVRLLSGMAVIWSLTTALAGFANSFVHVLASRMAVGTAEAGAIPTSLSIIGDRFNASRRASAVGLFFISSTLGNGLIFIVGGLVVEQYGWRTMFFLAGTPGLFLAILAFFTLREPKRGEMDNMAHPDAVETLEEARIHSFRDTVRFGAGQRSFLHLVAGIVLHSALSTGFLVWLMPFLLRVHHMPTAQAGLLVGTSFIVGGGIAVAASGFVTERLSRRSKAWQAIVPAITAFMTFGFGLGATFFNSTTLVVLMVVGFQLMDKSYFAPTYSLCVSLMKPRMRGLSIAGLQTLTNLIGSGVGPLLVGFLSDHYGGTQGLRYAMGTVVFVGVWTSAHFLLASRTVVKDLARAEGH